MGFRFFLSKENGPQEEKPYGQGPARPVGIVNVDLRDGQQSLLATRVSTEEFVPILERMDQVGYQAIECWGGATFDACVRFLSEDPWERLRTFKAHFKKTPLRMLLRGQNLVGYQQYPDDVVEKFVELAAKNGIDIFEIFDGMNDVRNTEVAVRAAKKQGKKVAACLAVCQSPVHTAERYVEYAKEYAGLGADMIYLEDMAGMFRPNQIFELVTAMRKQLSIPIHFHGHCAGGMMDLEYWEAIRAGVATIDVATSALAWGTSLPPVETFASALKGTCFDPGFDLDLLKEINDYFLELRKKHSDTLSAFVGVDSGISQHQIPGGMMSNLESQLKEMKAENRMPEILEEVHRVRADMGYPPLATPFAQMVGSQATFNVLMGERYKILSKELKAYVGGKYGRSPGPISQELVQKAALTEPPVTQRPGALLEPGWEKGKTEAYGKGLAACEEDAMTYILFPAVAEPFLKRKRGLA
ncbi:MAG TPA: pyruvate carboxylase subunit B [Candidatus Enterocloster faecavium]|uniref:Pyruvate carboxylase subunit B n=1 Tax=Candidatus Enterocloster faecavium TaxID=2838560 RepID=A0A9D2RNC0_9FIRM|nr:pyruvate carboxylase subunit B [Candidatus Enterocloster faecavium]